MSRSKHGKPVCAQTGKYQYSKKEALAAAAVNRKISGTYCRIYKCSICRHWHLTSKPLANTGGKGN